MTLGWAADPPRSGGGVYIYREGETPSGNVYATLAGALAALRTRPGTVVIDDSLGTPQALAGVAYDLTGVDLRAVAGAGASLLFNDGATLVGLGNVSGVSLVSLSSSPVVEVSAFALITLRDGASIITSTPSSAPFIHAQSGANVQLLLRDYSFLYAWSGAAMVLDCDVASNAFIDAEIACAVYDNCLSGLGGILIADLTGWQPTGTLHGAGLAYIGPQPSAPALTLN